MQFFSSSDTEAIKDVEEIRIFLEENNIEYSTEYDNFCIWYGNPDGKRSYEITYVSSKDFPIAYPSYGIDGVAKDFFFKISHKAEIEDNSFRLWIKDFEWRNPRQKEVLKSYILHAANKTPYGFYARDCEVQLVESKRAREFELENCFYGKRGASLNLGLYLKKDKNGLKKGDLLMIYTFGKNFFAKKDGIVEVIRVGTRKFCHVAGGSSKLFTHFLNNYKVLQLGERTMKVEQIKFYSDYDHNLGGSMEGIGFQFAGYSKGGFMNYWIEENKAKQREPMKHKWIMEQMSLGKVLAIPNAGIKNFILDIE